ncbi:MAG: GGDEF domain-containing protein [Planctomycetes bacterium]|nr:GGDEF domain-containing protein [Planctomycetota bacterium]
MRDPRDTDLTRTQFSLPRNPPATDGNRLAVLMVLRGSQVGRRYLLNENQLVLGRRGDRADLVIPDDPMVSAVHCRIERGGQPDTWQLVDLSSTNGTLVGGQRITTAMLRDGDRIHLGDTVLKFCYHDELDEQFHAQVDQMMNVDDLTGLPVQRVFQQRFHQVLATAVRAGSPLVVFMADMDGLKKINDQHGHLLGARAIAVTGRRLGAIVTAAGGVVSRFGGDEFSIFVPGIGRSVGLELGEKLRAAVAGEPVTLGGVSAQPTMSIGMACCPDDSSNAEVLTRHADEALYRAKADGRNCVRT